MDCANTEVALGSASNPTGSSYEITWSTTGGNIIGDKTGQFIDVNAPGKYIITVLDTQNGCENIDSVFVDIDLDLPTAIAGEDFILDCDNPEYTPNTTGSSSGGDYSYSWTTSDGNIVSGENSLSPVFNSAGTYILEVVNLVSGCTATDIVNLESAITPPDLSGQNTYILNCYNPDTAFSVVIDNYAGEYKFSWSTQDGRIVSGENDSLIAVDKAGAYTVLVLNTMNNCSALYEISVSENFNTPRADAGPEMEFDCATSELTLNGSASSSGSKYSYEWSGDPGNVKSGYNTLNPVIDEPGKYILIVTDNENGCSSSDEVIIGKSEDIPEVNAGGEREITCDSTEIRLMGNASGAASMSYAWTASNGGNIVSGRNTLTPIVNSPGTYTFKVINDENSCANTATIEVLGNTDPPEIAEPQEVLLTCKTLQPTLNAEEGSATSDAMEYKWSTENGNIIGGRDGFETSVDEPGTYTFTIMDNATGCSNSVDFTVTDFRDEPEVEIFATADTLTCERETITLNAGNSSQGIEYEGNWTAIDGGSVHGDTGAYTLHVTDPGRYIFEMINTENGCISFDTIIIEEDKDEPFIEQIDKIILTCAFPELSVTGVAETQGGAEYHWTSTTDNIVGKSDSISVNVNGEGTLTLSVTDLANYCTASIEVPIVEDKTPPIANAGESMMLTCDSNTVTLDGSASSSGTGFTYEWSSPNGGNIQSGRSTLSPVVDVAATYTLTVTDGNNGCTATSEVEVEIDENLPQIRFKGIGKITCADSTITIDASNSTSGSGYEYHWETTDGEIEYEDALVIVVSKPGTYTLSIIDVENDCKASANVTIVEDKEKPYIAIASPDVFDCITTSVTIDATDSENGDGDDIVWNTIDGVILSGSRTLTPEVGKAGIYELEILLDRNGCSNKSEVEVTASIEIPLADAGPDLTLTCVDTTLVIDAGNSSAGDEFTIKWNTQNGNILDGKTSLNPTINRGGTYVLSVINLMNNCVSHDTIQVSVDQDAPLLDYDISNELNCTFTEASIRATVENADKYEIEWKLNGQRIPSEDRLDLTVDKEGVYTLIVENKSNGCHSVAEIEVPRNANVIKDAFISTINPTCFNENGCLVIDSIIGGEMPYSIYVDGELKGSSLKVCTVTPRKHDVKIVDKNGCDIELTFEIDEQREFWVSIGQDYEIERGDSVTITYETDISDNLIEEIYWDWYLSEDIFCNYCDSITVQPLETTKLFFTLTDINGCTYDDFANIIVRKNVGIYVPTAFTPSDDGMNDILTVYTDEEIIEVVNFEIYDRWGERVFQAQHFKPGDESLGWDGRFKSERMAPDVYMFKVKVLYEDGNTAIVNGTTTILR